MKRYATSWALINFCLAISTTVDSSTAAASFLEYSSRPRDLEQSTDALRTIVSTLNGKINLLIEEISEINEFTSNYVSILNHKILENLSATETCGERLTRCFVSIAQGRLFQSPQRYYLNHQFSPTLGREVNLLMDEIYQLSFTLKPSRLPKFPQLNEELSHFKVKEAALNNLFILREISTRLGSIIKVLKPHLRWLSNAEELQDNNPYLRSYFQATYSINRKLLSLIEKTQKESRALLKNETLRTYLGGDIDVQVVDDLNLSRIRHP